LLYVLYFEVKNVDVVDVVVAAGVVIVVVASF